MVVVIAAACVILSVAGVLAWHGRSRFRELQKWSKAHSVAAGWSVHQPADPPVAATWCALVDAKRAAAIRKRPARRRSTRRAA